MQTRSEVWKELPEIVAGVGRVMGDDLGVFGLYLKPFFRGCCPGVFIPFYIALGNLEFGVGSVLKKRETI